MKAMLVAAAFLANASAFAGRAGADPREVLPWVEDYSKAVAQARAKNVPLFVEAWAPW